MGLTARVALFHSDMLVMLLALASSSALDLVPAVEKGCEPRLLGADAHPFVEAQIACDAYLSFALVDEILDGREAAPRVAVLHRLIVDAETRGVKPFPSRSVLSRGWLLMMLSGLARVDALTDDEARRYDSLADQLALDVSKGAWLESFRGGIWPCDHALAASGLILHGTLRNNTTTLDAGHALVARLDNLRERGFVTRVNNTGRAIESTPRGTVLAWTAGFLAMSGAPEAKSFADDLVRDFCGDAFMPGLAACREWPRGMNKKADAVSGPIVDGWGTGASALAIAATRANGLNDWFIKLDALSNAAAFMLNGERPLERAILVWARGCRRWI
jgi:hypothetical protein